MKLVLGHLWTLILKYQISQNKADASKNALLEWVNSKVVEHNDKNFSSDRNDGNTPCELSTKLEPDFINMNPKLRVAWLEKRTRHSSSSLRTVSSWSTSTRRTSSTVV